MNRYFFIYVGINTPSSEGEGNMGFIADGENPFSNEAIKKAFREQNPTHEKSGLVLRNFIEFKDEKEYKEFWAK